jgi:hypothetical protein
MIERKLDYGEGFRSFPLMKMRLKDLFSQNNSVIVELNKSDFAYFYSSLRYENILKNQYIKIIGREYNDYYITESK